jgi:hypothetical protein
MDVSQEQAEAEKIAALREGKASDADLVEWVAGLLEVLQMGGLTRAHGDEWIDTSYMAVLKARLSVE